jgi:NitT/TauT family transport system substrate-binding protein
MRHVRVATQSYLAHASIVIGVADSVFLRQGLDVELVPFARTTDAVPLLMNGDIDVLPGGAVPGLLNAAARGAPVRIVASRGTLGAGGCTDNAILVPKGRLRNGRPIRPVRRISIERQASLLFIIARSLESAGTSLERMELLQVPHAAEMDALARGTIDAAFVGEPWLQRNLDRHTGEIWISINRVMPNVETGFVFYGPNLLVKDRDTGRRFMIGYREAVRHYLQGKTERNVQTIAKATGDDPASLRQSCWPAMRADGRIDLAGLMQYQAWALEKGYLDAAATPSQVWDSSFVAYSDSVAGRAPH